MGALAARGSSAATTLGYPEEGLDGTVSQPKRCQTAPPGRSRRQRRANRIWNRRFARRVGVSGAGCLTRTTLMAWPERGRVSRPCSFRGRPAKMP